jgi:hypothetical protein
VGFNSGMICCGKLPTKMNNFPRKQITYIFDRSNLVGTHP